MAEYAIDLRSMTQGRGKFEFEFVRYEEAPAHIIEEVIKTTKTIVPSILPTRFGVFIFAIEVEIVRKISSINESQRGKLLY